MKRNAAFTLIELLVVIAIIAILAAILFPVFAQAKRAAKTASTISNTKQMAAVLHLYASEYDDWTPQSYWGTWYGDWTTFNTWIVVTFPYARSGSIYNDPGGSLAFNPVGVGVGTFNWTGYATFGCNEVGLFGWWEWTGTAFVWHGGRSLSAQENISERAAVMTNRDPRTDQGWGMFSFANWLAACPVPSQLTNPAYFYNNTAYVATKNHANQLVVAFADGHSKTVQGKRVMRDNATYTDWTNAKTADDPWIRFWGTDQDSATK